MIRVGLLLLALWTSHANAGYIEIGASGNYRISKIDDDNQQELISYTGSLSYYFWELSAIEFSYTQGKQEVTAKFPGDVNRVIQTTMFEMMGADLVLTLADKESFLQPYIKGGVARIKKKIIRVIEGATPDSDEIELDPTVVPSAGIGFKLKFTKTLSLKFGVDAWKSSSGSTDTIDYAGRAGISWMF
jgi:hypothetical protein